MTRHNTWPSLSLILPNGSVLHWDESFLLRSFKKLPVTCGECGKKREIFASKTRGKGGKTFTGLCDNCRKRIANHMVGPGHPFWKGGRFATGGYWFLSISGLSPEDQLLALPMGRKIHGKPAIVAEHRLVMALHLDRPLSSREIVHHKNGDSLDNRLDNLELTSHGGHRQLDVKYFKLWQGALKRIEELESELLKYK